MSKKKGKVKHRKKEHTKKSHKIKKKNSYAFK